MYALAPVNIYFFEYLNKTASSLISMSSLFWQIILSNQYLHFFVYFVLHTWNFDGLIKPDGALM